MPESLLFVFEEELFQHHVDLPLITLGNRVTAVTDRPASTCPSSGRRLSCKAQLIQVNAALRRTIVPQDLHGLRRLQIEEAVCEMDIPLVYSEAETAAAEVRHIFKWLDMLQQVAA